MKKYRKKPVIVEAIQLTEENWAEVSDFMLEANAILFSGQCKIIIATLEGDMTAQSGDWIIKGTQGEFYPCKPASFADTFEEVE